jgi:UDPglucose 6-dehydrogenase
MKIAMIGLGQVAVADALALGRVHQVEMTGPVPDRVDAINAGHYALTDPVKGDYLGCHRVDVTARLDTRAALKGAEMVLVSAPLSLDPDCEQLQMVELESRIELAAQLLPLVPIVIRSAVPVGFTETLRARLHGARLVYAPEFSREGAALTDILHPNVLIVGAQGRLGAYVAQVLASGALQVNIPVHLMRPTEAEVLRHISILCQSDGVGYFDALQRVAQNQSLHARAGFAGLGLKAPIEQAEMVSSCSAMGANPPCATRITALADHFRASGARKVGFYLGAGRPATDTPLAQLRAALDALGMDTSLHVVGAGDLLKFKEECDIVVATRMTADLHDIAPKLFMREHFAA